jgi:hypothetical protein
VRKGRNVAIQVMLLDPAGHRGCRSRLGSGTTARVAISFATRTVDGRGRLGRRSASTPTVSPVLLQRPGLMWGWP